MLNSGIESRFIDLMCYWHSCCCYLFMLVNSVSEIILSVHSTTWMNIYLYVLQYTIDLPHFPWENFKTVCVRPKLGIKFTICEINICQPHLSIHTSHVGKCQYYFNVPCHDCGYEYYSEMPSSPNIFFYHFRLYQST